MRRVDVPFIVIEQRLRRAPVTEQRFLTEISRRACVDLAQAQALAHHHVLGCEVRQSSTHMDPRLNPFYDQALSLSEEGGTVGPTPDGTVVTVEPVTLLALLADPDIRRDCSLSGNDKTLTAQAVRAYNRGR